MRSIQKGRCLENRVVGQVVSEANPFEVVGTTCHACGGLVEMAEIDAGGGNRTHNPLREPVFETGAYVRSQEGKMPEGGLEPPRG